ncbi:hypothetical protein, partial [Salibacterium aidingense]|uniref:hypothetical protein n=1 Tax=Salibacterium aidingense TaxID=384933 RepID=UPI001B7FB7F6
FGPTSLSIQPRPATETPMGRRRTEDSLGNAIFFTKGAGKRSDRVHRSHRHCFVRVFGRLILLSRPRLLDRTAAASAP